MVETLPDADDPNYAQIKEDLVVALGISYAGAYLLSYFQVDYH